MVFTTLVGLGYFNFRIILPIVWIVGEGMFQNLLIICVFFIQLILVSCTAIQQKLKFGVNKSLSVKDSYQVYSGDSVEISAEGCVGESCQFELTDQESGYLVSSNKTQVTFYAKNGFEGNASLNVTDGVQAKKLIQIQVRKKPTINKTLIKMAKGNQYLIAPTGGFTPFQFQIVDNENRPVTTDLNLNDVSDVSLRPQQKILKAGNTVGNYRLKVTESKDENPTILYIDIAVNEPLKLSPDNQILQINESLILNPSGGTETYVIQKISGSGTVSFDGTQWIYRAPASGSGNAEIQLKDNYDGIDGNNTAQITVNYLPAPDFRLVNASDRYTNKANVSLIVTNCTGSQIMINESATSDVGTWQTCPESPGTVVYSFLNSGSGIVNGEHQLYLRFKNNITGAIQTKANLSVFYDNVNPQLSNLTIDKTLYRAGQLATILWNQTETYKQSLQLSYGSGDAWETIANLTDDPSQYLWTIPTVNFVNKKIKLRATDKAGNASERLIDNVFEVDSTSPDAPLMSLVKEYISTNELFYRLTNCQGSNNQLKIIIKDFSNNVKHTVSKACSVTSAPTGDQLLLPALSEGFYTFIATLEDAAGNVSVAFEKTFTVDRTSPMGSFTTATGLYSGNKKIELNWNITDNSSGLADGYEIQYSLNGGMNYSTILSGVGVMIYSYSWTPPNITSDTILLRVKATDRAGNVGYVISKSGDYVFDAQKPLITAFAPQSGVTAVNKIAVDWKISASKSSPAQAKITHFMMSYAEEDDSLNPTIDDFRWALIDLEKQSLNVNLQNLRFQLGPVPRVYKVKAWVKDQLGNVSDAGTFLITLNPMIPAEVSNFIIANKNISGLSEFNSDTDIQFSSGSDMFVYWKITDDDVLGSNSLSIDYTLDNGATWVELERNINPNARTGCGLVVDTTGCVKIKSPSINSMVLRLKVTDSDGQASLANSMILNSGKISSIAGNVTEGLGGIHSNAIFFNSGTVASPNTFVMTSNGDMIMIEQKHNRVVYVSHQRGNKEVLLAYKSTFVPPTVSSLPQLISNTFVRYPTRIAIDKNDNVFLADYDRIRLFNVRDPNSANWQIKTIIGGGTNSLSKISGVDPGSIQFAPLNSIFSFNHNQSFVVTQNGTLYFGLMTTYTSDNKLLHGNLIGRYQISTNKVDLFEIQQSYSTLIKTTTIESDISFSNDKPPLDLMRFSVAYSTSQEEQNKIYLTGAKGKADLGRIDSTRSFQSNFASSGCELCMTYRASIDSSQSQVKIDSENLKSHQMKYQAWETRGGFYTGLDGRMYVIGTGGTYLVRLVESNRTNSTGEKEFDYTLIYGRLSNSSQTHTSLDSYRTNTNLGKCSDGTKANQCAANLNAVFVDTQGKIYVIDNQQVKTIDENGNVLTLYGQSPFYGDGELAVNARFTTIPSLSVWKSTNNLNIVLNDMNSYNLREFQLNGKIQSIAGGDYLSVPEYGSSAINSPIMTQGDNSNTNSFRFSILENGDILKGVSKKYSPIMKINRSTGIWENLLQTFSTASSIYYNLDDKVANSVDIKNVIWGDYFITSPIGVYSNKILLHDGEYKRDETTGFGAFQPATILEYDLSLNKIRRLAGSWNGSYTPNNGPMFCPDNTAATSCQLSGGGSINQYKYHPRLGWVSFYGNSIKSLYTASETESPVVKPILTVTNLTSSNTAVAFDFKQRTGSESQIYDFWYCANGKITQITWNSTNNSQVATELEWQVEGMSCESKDLHYIEFNNKKMLIFPYKMNGQFGVGKYLLL